MGTESWEVSPLRCGCSKAHKSVFGPPITIQYLMFEQ